MTSRDFGFLALRNITAYQPNGLPVPPNRVLITSTNGAGVFSNTLSISSISTNTISSATISNLVPYIGATKNLNMGLSSIVSKNIYLTNNNNGFVNLTIENNNYGNLDMNGYFIQYATGASQSSNPIVSLPSDNGQPTYFINSGNFGIGTITPQAKLDVTGNTLLSGNVNISTNQSGYNLNIVNTNNSGTYLSLDHSNTQNIFRMATDTSKFIWFNSGSNPGAGLVPSTLQLYAYDIPGDTPAPALIVDINGRIGIGSNSLPQEALDVTGNLIVNGTSVSRVSTTSIPSNPGSGGWTSYYGKYCFVDGDSVGTLTLPTAGDVPSDGTILVIRNIGTSGTITINNSIGGASILAGKTISYVYTTTVAAGWYSLYN